MAWGFDFDVGGALESIFDSVVETAADVAESIEISDVLQIASVGGALLLQNKAIEEQSELIKQQQDNALAASKTSISDIASLADEQFDNQGVKVRKVDIGTDESEDETEDVDKGRIDLEEELDQGERAQITTSDKVKSKLPGFKI